jgi:hypothetical protein
LYWPLNFVVRWDQKNDKFLFRLVLVRDAWEYGENILEDFLSALSKYPGFEKAVNHQSSSAKTLLKSKQANLLDKAVSEFSVSFDKAREVFRNVVKAS